MAYSGRLAIIAGGLGGLGTATARLLHSKGCTLALLYGPFESHRRDTVISATFGSATTSAVRAFECDITDETSVASAFEQIDRQSESDAGSGAGAFPCILVNAAGYVSVLPLEETSQKEAMANFLPNLLGPFNLSTAFFRMYRWRVDAAGVGGEGRVPPGRIVSISSQASHVALDGHGAYCASKAGLNGLTRCMANEWGGRGVTANTVSPTVALTALGKKAWADDTKRQAHLAQIPTGRFAQPEEIAEAIEFLCRDESGMINGTDVRIDGGYTIR